MTNERTTLPSSPNELVEAWLKATTETERRWNEYLNQVMGTEAYAEISARAAESATAMQASFARGMEQYLRAFTIPTQSDLATLAERLTVRERRVDARAATPEE